MKICAALLVITASLAGCALAPNTIRTDVEHLSHISQHFGADRTNYGAEMVGVTAQWRTKSGWFAEWGEHYNLGKGNGPGWTDSCAGGICGPREVTTVSAGYIFEIKK
jgi:hypothetical protein